MVSGRISTGYTHLSCLSFAFVVTGELTTTYWFFFLEDWSLVAGFANLV